MYFLFGVHNHQPGGNFDQIKEKAFKKAYLPFLEILKGHPKIKFSLHISGSLYAWIKRKHPQYLFVLKKMVRAGQAEVWGGPYGEAILPMIPERDTKEQIHLFSKILEKDFNCKIGGFWIPERVWEPSLIKIFKQGSSITALDENHFELAGIKNGDIDSYFTLTSAKSLKIFPIPKRLRYIIPFSYPKEVINWILKEKRRGKISVAYFDDGEKFGLWPTTYRWVYKRRWFDRFLSLLEESSKIKTIHFKDFVKSFPPKGSVQIPPASYPEMMEWTLPLKIRKKIEKKKIKEDERKKYFLTQARFQNFFQKYSESNHLKSKMFHVSSKIEDFLVKNPFKNISRVQENLFEAQTNDVYWHGGFGGLYHPHLRSYAYKKLILAEKEIYLKDKSWALDFNKDNKKEIILETKNLNLYLNPENGGAISEIDLKKQGYNILNILTRRKESYHQFKKQKSKGEKVKKGPKTIHEIKKSLKNFKEFIIYDKYQKLSFIDHFLTTQKNVLNNFYRAKLKEKFDFIEKKYQCEIQETKNEFNILMEREGKNILGFSKKINVSKGKENINFVFEFENKTKKELKFLFGNEWNLFLPSAQYSRVLFNKLVRSCLKRFQRKSSTLDFVDNFFKIKISFSFRENVSICHFPIITVSQKEDKFEKIYQGSSFLFLLPIKIKPKRILQKSFSLKF